MERSPDPAPIRTPASSRTLLYASPALLVTAGALRARGGDPRRVGYVADTPLPSDREDPSSLSALLLAAADDVADRRRARTDTEGGLALTPDQEATRRALLGQASLALDLGIPIWSDSDLILDRATRWLSHEAIQRPGLAGALWATAQSPHGLPSGRAASGLVNWPAILTSRPGVDAFVADLVAALPDRFRIDLQARVRLTLFFSFPSVFYLKSSVPDGWGTTTHLINLANQTSSAPDEPWGLSSEQATGLLRLLRDSVERAHLMDLLQGSADLSRRWRFTISRLSDDAAARLLVAVASLLPVDEPEHEGAGCAPTSSRIKPDLLEGPTMLDVILEALATRSWTDSRLVLRADDGAQEQGDDADLGVPLLSVLRHLGIPTAPPAARFIRALVERSLLDSSLLDSGERGTSVERAEDSSRPIRRL